MTNPFDLANEGSTEFWSELFDQFERRIVLFTQPLVIAVISSAANFDSLDCLAAVYGDDRPAALSYDQVLLAGTNVHLYVPHRRAIDSASGERRAEKLSPNDLSPTESAAPRSDPPC